MSDKAMTQRYPLAVRRAVREAAESASELADDVLAMTSGQGATADLLAHDAIDLAERLEKLAETIDPKPTSGRRRAKPRRIL